MASKEATLSSLYSELNRFGKNGEYERALKIANKILSQAPEEEEAFHCKIVCLIQLSKFQEALQAILKNSKLTKELYFEKAYCQYRLNQPLEALQTVNSSNNLDQRLRELKAQILYRLEQYEECFETYKAVIKNSHDDYEDEREANLSAVIANLYLNNYNKDLPTLREHTFELAYNAACHLLGRGLYIEAEKKLKVAEKLCREALEEDGTSEEDIESEVGIIRGQLAYCLQMQGREKEAQAIYNVILKSKPTDIGLVAVASNNSVTLNRDQNLFDSKKKMKNATAEGVEHKLTKLQRKNIAFNQCLLTIYTNQAELGKSLCHKLAENYPEYAGDAAIVQAVQYSRDNKIKEAVNLLESFAKKEKDRELDMKLACVQIMLSNGNKMEACRLLESLGENGFRPGIISALVTLYLSEDNRVKASEIFKNAVERYRNKKQSNQGDLSALWRQAADFHLRSGEPQVAANSLEELLRLNPNDSKTLAQLVVAYAQFDAKKAQNLSQQLPQLNLSNKADVELLENSNWVMGTKVIKKVAKVEASPKPGTPGGDDLIKKKKKNKKKKGKLPKFYEPGVPPDPERWLPKHQRTGWKKKKDRRGKDVGKGTQGSATGASDLYDITKMSNLGSKNSTNPSSPVSGSHGPRQQKNKFHLRKLAKLENFTFNGRLTLQDSDFVEDVASDIRDFVKGQSEKRVLVFPPFNSFRRCLIHQLVEHYFENLKSFSIGQGDGRRTVVCFNKDFKSQPQVLTSTASCVALVEQPLTNSVVKPISLDSTCSDNDSLNKRVKRAKTMPSVSIYRPPAARRLEQNSNLSTFHPTYHRQPEHEGRNEEIGSTEPEKSEIKCSEESKNGVSSTVGRKIHENGISVFRNAISSIRTQNKTSTTCKSNPENSICTNKKCESVLPPTPRVDDHIKSKPRRPDIQVYVPKGRRSAPQTTLNHNESLVTGKSNCGNYFGSNCIDNKPNNAPDNTPLGKDDKNEEDNIIEKKEVEKLIDDSVIKSTGQVASEIVQVAAEKVTEKKEVTSDQITTEKNNISNFVEEVSLPLNYKLPEVPEDHKSSNLLVSSQSSGESPNAEEGGVLLSSSNVSEKENKKNDVGVVETKNDCKKSKEIHLNPDECDWESMFDDTGECLDPSLLEQLTTAVGDVTIETPKTGYENFKTKSLDVMADEFPHVIEIYNFPPEFQLQDLMTVFSQFKNSGFEIKWVDDTHALGIFSSSAVVSEVLSFYHPFVKTRSLKEGTPLSKMKARRSAEFLLPYKPRPDTCPALARRLVTGALGVKLKTSREEREAEKKILTEAREKKKLEARQKEDAWEGTFS